MNNIKAIFIFCVTFFVFIEANAQYQGNYVGFNVANATSLTVNQSAKSTTFNIQITASRFYGANGYQPFKMNFKIGVENGSVFSTIYTITDSDFQSGQGNTTKQFSVTLTNSSLPHGGNLIIHYNNPSNSNPTYTPSYNPKVYINNPPPSLPAISNNLITLQYNPVIDSEVNISGSSPNGGNGIYNYEWQIKIANGNFYTVPSHAITNLNLLKIFSVLDGSTIRRKLTSGDKTSYSNEILLKRDFRNDFTVQKTKVFNGNGEVIGNNFKITLDSSNPNAIFQILFVSLEDPVLLTVHQEEEFFVPIGNLYTGIKYGGCHADIYPTWAEGGTSPHTDIYRYYY